MDRDIPKPNRIRHAKLCNNIELEAVIDDVMVAVFKSPHSYTGEDVVEISTHGSPIVINKALEAFYKNGARPAGPGEFTLRAFLNERIDLLQAEAVADLIAARSSEAANQAVKQLEGGVSKFANELSDRIMQLLSSCELELDFVEEGITLLNNEEKSTLIDHIINNLKQMIAGYSKARNLRKGVSVALIGAPNVGKSSLFNILADDNIAIVHDAPGTTRDVLEANCIIKGVHFTLYDTAGLRETPDEVEDEGVNRAIRKAENADVIISITSPDVTEHSNIKIENNNRTIYVSNKSDLVKKIISENSISVSALNGTGMHSLRNELYNMVVDNESIKEGTISRERHFMAVQSALTSMEYCKKDFAEGQSEEIIAEQLNAAISAMDELTGKKRSDGLLDEIFSEFCIGK